MNTRSKRQLSVSPPGRTQSSKRTAKRTAVSATAIDVATATHVSPLTSLPADVASTLLSFLTAKDLLKCMRVNSWCKQQIYTSTNLQNTIFRWTPTRRPKQRFDGPSRAQLSKLAKRVPISLPHLRRLHVDLPGLIHGGDTDLTASCQNSVAFVLNEVHHRCQQLVDLRICFPVWVMFPTQVQGQLTSLQTLRLDKFSVTATVLTKLGALYPNVTSLLLQPHQHEVTLSYCRGICQSFPRLQALLLTGGNGYTQEHITELAPLVQLRYLYICSYGDPTLTVPAAWPLETLEVIAHPVHDNTPIALQRNIDSLRALAVSYSGPGTSADRLVESLVTSGAVAALNWLSWQNALLSGTAVHQFAHFTALRKLSLAYHLSVQLVCDILLQLPCQLVHFQYFNRPHVPEIKRLYVVLADTPAVRHCHTIGLPSPDVVDTEALQQLVQHLPQLQRVYLMTLNYKTGLTTLYTAGREIPVKYTLNSRMTHSDAAAARAYSLRHDLSAST